MLVIEYFGSKTDLMLQPFYLIPNKQTLYNYIINIFYKLHNVLSVVYAV